jgi:hypothetical protein
MWKIFVVALAAGAGSVRPPADEPVRRPDPLDLIGRRRDEE